MAKLTRGARRIFDFLTTCKAGDEIDRQALLAVANLKESSLRTYVTKNKITPYLRELPSGKFRVVRDGNTLDENEFNNVFTQKGPSSIHLSRKDRLVGEAHEYILHEELGRGAVGRVWQAHRRSDKRPVAIKIVDPRPDLLSTSVFENVNRRFERERENGMRLRHPHVVEIMDKGKHEGAPFLVMALGERSAHDLLEKRGAIDLPTALLLTRHAAAGLQFIHEARCVHRDVKPRNILEFAGRWVLGDLGIVKWSDMNPDFVSAGTITVDSARLGSMNYMAPEQQDTPHAASPASDVYALGVTLYELTTGRVPHPAAFATGAFDPTGHGDTVDRLIRQMVRYAPADRPSLREVITALEALGAPAT